MSHDGPLVTLGVPVFNGGQQLEPALRALLAQTWPRLEILISDNASTDGTEALCRRVAAEDARVRYMRQPDNIGAAPNFEWLAHEARGELFAWCAHDDLRMPTFVEACVRELLRRPDAVLCNSAVVFLDEDGRPRSDWEDSNFETRASTRPERAQRLVDHMDWVDMYGLIRRDALLRALPIEPVWGGDVVISMKLLMQGEFAKVEEPLFHYRVRSRPKSPEQTMWDFAKRDGGVPRPYTEMIQALLRAAMQAAADRAERADLLVRVLRAVVDLEPRGPHPCWRQLLKQENRAELGKPFRPETFPRHVLRWLAAVLPGTPEERDAEAVALVVAGARRALVVADGPPSRSDETRAGLRALRERLPGAQWALLCPESWSAHRDASLEADARFSYDPQSDAAAAKDGSGDAELARLRAWRPDLVFDLSANRGHRLDRLATGAGALLGFARPRGSVGAGPRRWFGLRKRYDRDARWTHVADEDVVAQLDRVRSEPAKRSATERFLHRL